MRTGEADSVLSASLFGKEGYMRKAVAYLAVSLDGFICLLYTSDAADE